MASDRAQLLDMGFEEARVTAALKATGNAGLQAAMDWLFAHADDPLPTETAEAEVSAAAGGGNDDAIPEEEATAASLKCDDCGRLLRDAAAAEFHAIKTQHQNFSESTQVIKPLTEEEKKIKLEQLKIKMAEKKEQKRLQEIEENKAKEKVRRTTGKEMVEIKEKLAELEMKKAADAKKREKEEDRIAKAKIKAQIELDKRDRAARMEKEKLERQGLQAPALVAPVAAAAASAAGPKEYAEARIQLRLPTGGPITHTFKSSDTLKTVYAFVSEQTGATQGTFKLATTFPRKVLDDESKTLKELGLAPSAALAVV
ncbi:ubiquitin-related domain-containing protein [Obelidium mucronatum]|nr:ubiquitin-related domain-containing protein [Obelidium mucronatum]